MLIFAASQKYKNNLVSFVNMDYKSILRTIVKVFVPLTCGLLLLWFLYGKMDLNEIMNVVRKGVRYDIIIFSCIFCLFANTIRAYRWGLLIESLGEKYKTFFFFMRSTLSCLAWVKCGVAELLPNMKRYLSLSY